MFLSSMTTDAAAQHGHEFSASRSPSPNPRAFSSPRSYFSAVFSAVSKTPTFLMFDKETTSTATREPSNTTVADTATTSHTVVDNAPSRPSSATSSTEGDVFRHKARQLRPKTVFNLAHPPPAPRQRQKLHVRPRVILQLHKVTAGSRPKPEYDVVPATRCPARLARKFSRIYSCLEKLGPDDVVIMRSDCYDPAAEDNVSSDDDLHDGGDPIGVVSMIKSEDGNGMRTEICMDDNTVWDVTQLRNGNYEFKTTDEHGLELKSRWVARLPKRRLSTQSLGKMANGVEEKKFQFSTISADSRRHPVIASMTPSKIDINDEYSIPSKVDSSPSETPQATPSVMSDAGSYMDTSNQTIHTDDVLRRFILVSGIYVALRENWSPGFQYSQSLFRSASFDMSPSMRRRTASMQVSDTASVLSSASSDDAPIHRTLPRFFRTGSNLRRSTIPTSDDSGPARASTLPINSLTRRSNSTGSAYLQRSASKRHRKRASMPADLPEADEESESEKDHSSNGTPVESTLNSPKIVVAPMLPTADEIEENQKEEILAATETDANDKENVPRIRSAYLPPESTKNLWDSGESATAQPSKDIKKKRLRPVSLGGASPIPSLRDSNTKKPSSLRRVISIFRKDKS